MKQHFKRNLLSLVALGIFLFLALGSLPNTNKNSGPAPSPSRSANTTTYTNSRSQYTGKLADNYVDFSFDYPSDWQRDPDAGRGTDPNFVKVEKMSSDNKATIENFAVGWVSGPSAVMPQLARQLSTQLSSQFPEYKKVSEGEVRIGPYDGYEFRFTSTVKLAEAEGYLWGRVVLLPSDTGRKGAVLLMLASSASPDVQGPEDVGDKGQLPIILNSFRFGD